MSQTDTTSIVSWLEDEPDDEKELYPQQPFWRRPLYIALAVIVVVALIGGALFIKKAFLTTKPIQYQYSNASTGNLAIRVSATGPVASTAVYNLNFPTPAKLTELDVSLGQQVQAGQVLAKIDPTALQDAVNQAQASANSSWTNYQNAILNLNDVKAQNNPCPTTGNPPKTQAQCTQAIDQAQEQVNSDWSQYQVVLAQLQTAQDNLGGATLTAPAAGTVVSINGVIGQTVGSGGGSGSGGSSGSSAFIVLENLSQLSITAQVNEADIASVKVGQTASFTVEAYPGDTFHGSVTAISPIGQTSSSVVTYPVTISVDTSNLNGANLLPGMTATLQITTQERIGVVLLPNKALTFARTLLATGQISSGQIRSLLANAAQNAGSQTQQGTPTFVVELKNGKLTPKIIYTGLTNGTNTEVISGLADGEQVVSGQVGATATTTTGGTGGGGGIFGGGGFGGGGGRGGGGGGGGGSGG
jgi:RND family efflux transporter MFP subunit